MARLKQLIHEIHRRSLWQVLGIYVVGGWFVLQVVDTMVGALRLPDWAPPIALILLILGLPSSWPRRSSRKVRVGPGRRC